MINRVALRVVVVLGLLMASFRAGALEGGFRDVILQAHSEARRYVVVEENVLGPRLGPPYAVWDVEANKPVAAQWEKTDKGHVVRWMVESVPANQKKMYRIQNGQKAKDAVVVEETSPGALAIKNATREITRYQFGELATKHKHPFFYPVTAQGVRVTRSFPMENAEGEARDHPHHTSLWFAHGEVNGRDYWAKLPITHKRIVEKTSGPVYGRIVAENAWGADVIETQDVRIYDVGQDVLMDWTITLAAAGNQPVKLGKTKEGGLSVRVVTPLTAPEPGRAPRKNEVRGEGKMVDALGNEGEVGVRPEKRPAGKKPAVWADNYGVIDGKPIGVAIMNHPQSWRHPTDWHVRNYGLFAANAFMEAGEHELKQGEPVVLKYRVYIHGGTPEQAKVSEVYAGYASSKVQSGDERAELTPLFNGKDLSGFVVPQPNLWWKVVDGVLVGESDEKLRGSMLYTQQAYKDVTFQADVRYSGDIDSGFMFRKPEMQVQIGVSRSLKKDMTCSVYFKGKYPWQAQGVDWKTGDWNTIRVRTQGNKHTVWCNGKQVLEFEDASFTDPAPIGLQVHGNVKMKVEFRNIMAKEL